ncbi:MAG: glutaredoxin family protein [Chloroflexi bacterium]|nr:glutaredoxin family protein [Chloroflexota bacterium]
MVWRWWPRWPGRKRPCSIIFYTKPDCGLCDEARRLLDRLGRDFSLEVTELDITQDERLFQRYALEIPVVIVDGRIELVAPITEQALREALAGC